MKILQVTAVDFTAKKFLLPLVDELNSQNFEVHIACNIDKIGEDLRKDGYIMKHIPFSRNLNIISHSISFYKIVKLIRSENYDSIHTHTPVASIIARVAAKLTRTPLNIYTAHGFYFHENMGPIKYKIAYFLEKFWGRYFTDYLFFQSKEDYELAFRDQFNKPERLIHINNGVSGERFNPSAYDRSSIRKSLGLKKEKVIMFVGRLVEEKGIKELILAFEILSSRHEDLKLLLVGGQVTGDRDGLSPREIISKMPDNIKQNIHLLDSREDIPEILAASDVFTLPSYREGLPRSIIEAMAMGKPIVATDIRGCREEVFDGINGYLCKIKDVNSLVVALELLLNDSEKIQDFGNQSRKIFLEEFEEQKVLKKQLKVFNEFREKKHRKDFVESH